ncbi:LysR family transcriptional regulator, partial [Streptomyces sp. PSKA30]|nr:LysR family transcriptional regulator [Streptomyces sp. PSKA30]
VALCWPEDAHTDLVEDFIGIVRGRTVNSTRGRAQSAAQPKEKRRDEPAARRKPAARKNPRSGTAKSVRRGKPRRRS